MSWDWIAWENGLVWNGLPKIRAKTEFCLNIGQLGLITVKLERLFSQVNCFETTSLAKYPNLRPLSLLKPWSSYLRVQTSLQWHLAVLFVLLVSVFFDFWLLFVYVYNPFPEDVHYKIFVYRIGLLLACVQVCRWWGIAVHCMGASALWLMDCHPKLSACPSKTWSW